MAACIFCKSEKELCDGSVPMCVRCSDAGASKRKPPTSEDQFLNVLNRDFKAATERSKAATAAFDEATSEIPGALPHPNGTQRIHDASRQVTIARMEMLRAHHRLSDFLNAGVVPDDLKQGSGS
jgi:hypothetical protein